MTSDRTQAGKAFTHYCDLKMTLRTSRHVVHITFINHFQKLGLKFITQLLFNNILNHIAFLVEHLSVDNMTN
ncbi:Uncharacterised protein [Vibrio cholerae]|nr:Uncharacterised protein [Vibrio cholerae]